MKDARFYGPNDLFIENDGRILVVDSGNDKIRMISGDQVTTLVRVNGVQGIMKDSDGSFILLKRKGLDRMSSNGEIHPIQCRMNGGREFDWLIHGCFLPDGDFVFTDINAHVIWRMKMDGEVDILAGRYGVVGHKDGSSDEAIFTNLFGITCDGEGNIYVNSQSHCIRKITRIVWRPMNHEKFPKSHRFMIRTLMTLWRMSESSLNVIHRDVLFLIFDLLM